MSVYTFVHALMTKPRLQWKHKQKADGSGTTNEDDLLSLEMFVWEMRKCFRKKSVFLQWLQSHCSLTILVVYSINASSCGHVIYCIELWIWRACFFFLAATLSGIACSIVFQYFPLAQLSPLIAFSIASRASVCNVGTNIGWSAAWYAWGWKSIITWGEVVLHVSGRRRAQEETIHPGRLRTSCKTWID